MIRLTTKHSYLKLSGAHLFIWLLMAGVVKAQSAAVRVWEAPLLIPTYALGPADPNPPLLDWDRRKWRPLYPYPTLRTLTNERTVTATLLSRDAIDRRFSAPKLRSV